MNATSHNSQVWDKVLGGEETLRYEFTIGEQYIKTYIIVWAIISLPFVFALVGVFIFLAACVYFKVYLPKANIYGFTNKRVLIHRGFFSTNLISVDYTQITDVTVQESFLDKLFTKTGTLYINTAGTSGAEIVLENIAEPYEVKKKLDQLRDTH